MSEPTHERTGGDLFGVVSSPPKWVGDLKPASLWAIPGWQGAFSLTPHNSRTQDGHPVTERPGGWLCSVASDATAPYIFHAREFVVVSAAEA